MTFAEAFAEYWWVLVVLAAVGGSYLQTISSERRARAAMDLIKTYVEQGKEPPPELFKIAAKDEIDPWTGGVKSGDSQSSGNGGWWMFVIFAALGVGFGSSYWFVERDGAYLLVAIITGVIALGSLLITIFGRK